MTRVGVVTQARMTSSRLPGKVLLESGGKTMLRHHVERLMSAGLSVCVATTTNGSDAPVVAEAVSLGAQVFRGDENDVLSRYAGAARQFGLDVVVRATSDCPLIDGALVRSGLDRFLKLNAEYAYVSNVLDRTYPRGFDFEIFSAVALLEAAELATAPAEREHVTPYMHASHRMSFHSVRREHDASGYRLTLDTKEDFDVIRRLFDDFGAADLDVEQLISIMDRHPELVAVNAHIEQKRIGHEH